MAVSAPPDIAPADAATVDEDDRDPFASGVKQNAAPARLVLALVGVFAIAFIAVIGLKVQRERVLQEHEARLAHGDRAAVEAGRLSARLAAAYGAVSGSAAGIQTDWTRSDEAILAHLTALAARPTISAAALIDADGTVLLTSDTDADVFLTRALNDRGATPIWTASGPDRRPALYAADDFSLEAGRVTLAAMLNGAALSEPTDRLRGFAVTDSTARAFGGGQTTPSVGVEVLTQLFSDQVQATTVDLPSEDGQSGAAAAPVDGAAGVYVVYVAPLVIDRGEWRRTLMFYVLLLLAPVLVAVGLVAVLLTQMDHVRQTRRALYDSERRFRLAVEGARCGVWDWDMDQGTVFITASMARVLGRREAGVLSQGEFLALVRDDDREPLQVAIRNAARTGQVDIEFHPAQGQYVLHARGKPWRGVSDRRKNRIVGVAIDVTEHRSAQQRMRRAEKQLQAALESMSESFVLWDSDRRLVLSNARFTEVFKLNPDQARAGASYDALELAASAAIKDVTASSEGGDHQTIELKDGGWLHYSERQTSDGGVVSIGTDITELKRQEERLTVNDRRLRQSIIELSEAQQRLEEARSQAAEALERAEAASRAKTQFLAHMSHELRTPLNAVNGFSEIMLQEMFGPLGHEKYREYLQDIRSSGQLLLSLISDILEMSKIEAGKMKLAYERVYPDEIAEQCVRLMRGKAAEVGLTLQKSIDNLPEIYADPRAIKQILLNLLSNSTKFTPKGGRIELQGRAEAGGVVLSVVDTGEGIAPEDLDRLGRPFEQIERKDAETQPGSGLGLALSKSFAQMHGGWLRIESAQGVGTTVSVFIPRTRPAELEAETDETDETGATGSPRIAALDPLPDVDEPPAIAAKPDDPTGL